MVRAVVTAWALAASASIASAGAPNAPSGVVVTVGELGRVDVRWRDNSADEIWFDVERDPAFLTSRLCRHDAPRIVDVVDNGPVRYRVRALGRGGASAWSAWTETIVDTAPVIEPPVMGLVGPDGWTELVPSADTRMVFVSSSEGNDANDGLSDRRPKRTIAAGIALLRHQQPDWLLLKRGDTWDEGLGNWRLSGRSAAEPMVVTGYGDSTQRPLLRTVNGTAFSRTGGGGTPAVIHSLSLVGLHLSGAGRPANFESFGIVWIGRGNDFLVEDCYIEGYGKNISIETQSDDSSRFMIRRSVIVDAYWSDFVSTGIYADSVKDLLIEECVFDRNGFKDGAAERTVFNHNIYLQNSVYQPVLRGNIIADGSSHGAQLRLGGIAEDNLFLRNPIALLISGLSADNVTVAPIMVARRNVVLDGIDQDATQVRGWGIQIERSNRAVVVENIIANQGTGTGPSAYTFNGLLPPGCRNAFFIGNIAYDWRGSTAFKGSTSQLQSIVSASNMLQDPVTTACCLVDLEPATLPGQVFGTQNKYFTTLQLNRWFFAFPGLVGIQEFRLRTGDTTSVAWPVPFADPSRGVARYHATLGRPATHEAFMAEARKQSKANWRPEYTAKVVNAWVRQGFVVDP